VPGAQAAAGLAKIGATAALMGVAGGSMLDLAEAGLGTFRSGVRDLDQAAPSTMRGMRGQVDRLPAPIAQLAHYSLDTTEQGVPPNSPYPQGWIGQNGQQGDRQYPQPGRILGEAAGTSLAMLTTGSGDNRTTARSDQQAQVDHWLEQMYASQQLGQGRQQVLEAGQSLLGEDLVWKVERALGRRSPEQTAAVLVAARAVAEKLDRKEMIQDGRLTPAAVEAVRQQLDPETAPAFQGRAGSWDLAALTAVALQESRTAPPEQFRQAVARARVMGEETPAQQVPRTLSLDPVAAGAHYAAINRFVQSAEQAGLSPEQRAQLLAEAQSGQMSDGLRADLEAAIEQQRAQGRRVKVSPEAVIDSALAMPETLSGPRQIWTGNLSEGKPRPAPSGRADRTEGDVKRSTQSVTSAKQRADKPPLIGTQSSPRQPVGKRPSYPFIPPARPKPKSAEKEQNPIESDKPELGPAKPDDAEKEEQ
jgi:hypothetical protein